MGRGQDVFMPEIPCGISLNPTFAHPLIPEWKTQQQDNMEYKQFGGIFDL